MFNFTHHVCAENFHLMNINVSSDVGAPPLNTQPPSPTELAVPSSAGQAGPLLPAVSPQ